MLFVYYSQFDSLCALVCFAHEMRRQFDTSFFFYFMTVAIQISYPSNGQFLQELCCRSINNRLFSEQHFLSTGCFLFFAKRAKDFSKKIELYFAE